MSSRLHLVGQANRSHWNTMASSCSPDNGAAIAPTRGTLCCLVEKLLVADHTRASMRSVKKHKPLRMTAVMVAVALFLPPALAARCVPYWSSSCQGCWQAPSRRTSDGRRSRASSHRGTHKLATDKDKTDNSRSKCSSKGRWEDVQLHSLS